MRSTAALLISGIALAGCAKTHDAKVIEDVLDHFLARADTSAIHPNGVTIVAKETDIWSQERFQGFTLDRQEDPCEVAPELYKQFFERNASAGSAVALLVPNARRRLITPQDFDPLTDGLRTQTPTGEDIRTYVSLSYPAYSPDGETAYVQFFFTYFVHEAIAQYLVKKSGSTWVVQCSRLHFYV